MKTKRLFISLVGLIGLLISGCATPTPANPPTPTNPADRFAGTWLGTMSFSDDPNHKEVVGFTIFADCKPGSFCGEFNDDTVTCIAGVKLVAVKGDVFEYEFVTTQTPGDQCLDSGKGTLTLQSNGTLLREHNMAGVTASGMLKHK